VWRGWQRGGELALVSLARCGTAQRLHALKEALPTNAGEHLFEVPTHAPVRAQEDMVMAPCSDTARRECGRW